MRDTEKQITILHGYDSLSELQKTQFRRVITDGLRGKFTGALGSDTAAMLSVVEIWIRYGFLPMSNGFCAADAGSGDVLAILLLNDFNKPDAAESLFCLLRVMRAIGVRKALKIAFQFLAVDNINKEPNPGRVVSEIYLVSTSEAERGKGVGTRLIRYVLDYLNSAYPAPPAKNAERSVKLLVFEKNPAAGLYERLGFRRTGFVVTPKIARAFGEAYDVLVQMERPL